MNIFEEIERRRTQTEATNFDEAAKDFSDLLSVCPPFNEAAIKAELRDFNIEYSTKNTTWDDLVEFYQRMHSYRDRVNYLRTEVVGAKVGLAEKAAKDLSVMCFNLFEGKRTADERKALAESLVYPYKKIINENLNLTRTLDAYSEELKQICMDVTQILKEKQSNFINYRYLNEGLSVSYDRMGGEQNANQPKVEDFNEETSPTFRRRVPPKMPSLEE